MALVLASMLATACEHKELCYEHPHWVSLCVEFDFGQLPPPHNQARSMRVHFYPVNGKEPHTFDFPDGESATISLPTGAYRAICFNNDTQYIDYFGEQQAERLTATTETVPTPDGKEAYTTPDWLMGSSLPQVNVMRNADMEQTVTFTPTPKVCLYTFEVRGIKNTRYISDMRASLSGMAGQLLMYANELTPDDSHQILTAAALKDGICQGGFYTFGHAIGNETKNIFTLFIKNKKGKIQAVEADVTDQVWNFPTTGHLADVHLIIYADITIDNDVPGGSGTDAGFDVGVDDWSDIHKDIIL